MDRARLRSNSFSLLFLITVALGGCGPTLRPPEVSPQLLRQEASLQREFTYKLLVERKIRLQRIYTPMRIANADLCGPNVSPVTGITGIDLSTLQPEMREIAQRVHGVSDGVKIIDIVPGSPAAELGLIAGDVITGAAVGAGVVPSGWSWSSLTIPELVKVITQSQGGAITLLVRRGSAIFPVSGALRLGCKYPAELKFDESLNASADGTKINVNTGLFNYLSNDGEIAFIVGHELSHNILQHVQKKEGNAAAGAAAGLLVDVGLAVVGINSGGLGTRLGTQAGAIAYSKEFEAEADYLSLYLLARSGFDIASGQNALRRMGYEKPSAQAQVYFSTHPSTPERAAAMQLTVNEITSKNDRHEALLPTTLPGEKLAVTEVNQKAVAPVVIASVISPGAGQSSISSTAPAVLPNAPSSPAVMPATFVVNQPQPVPTTPAIIASKQLAQLYLIKGPIVSSPPQTFNGEFLPSGKAQVVLSGRRLLTGDFELFELGQSVKAKYNASLVNPDNVKPIAGADAKGFAALSDNGGTQLECAYSFSRSTGRGEGTCADNRRNTYRLVFD
jgi:Zn-dependent protease with chaperone function